MNYRDAALGASEWLLSQAIDAGDGWGWPEDPGEDIDHSLYGGGGVILTMLDAHAASGDARFREAAERGADRLIARGAADEYVWCGLYVGMAGVGFILNEVGRRDDVTMILERLIARDRRVGTDIIYGTAGTICALEQLDRHAAAVDLARWLASVGDRKGGGRDWRHDLSKADYMPNFSHGTAGIAYALATAGLIDEAIAGVNYLVSVAERPDAGFRVFHYEPDDDGSFPLGWCHGPTGTARLFQLLADKTGDARWIELRDACAHTVRTSGIPERKEPGFWDNVAACCGSTGVAKFFLGLHRRTGDDDHLAFARVMADDIVERATVDDTGVRWSNIEHRNPDPVLPPGLGQMQGAAGIASFLFELDRYLNGDGAYRRWPDNPF